MDVAELLRLHIRRRSPGYTYADCPFCGDRRGKMCLNLMKNVWYSNCCGGHGGMLSLYAKARQISNSEAYREICEELLTGGFAPAYEVQRQETVRKEQAPQAASIGIIGGARSVAVIQVKDTPQEETAATAVMKGEDGPAVVLVGVQSQSQGERSTRVALSALRFELAETVTWLPVCSGAVQKGRHHRDQQRKAGVVQQGVHQLFRKAAPCPDKAHHCQQQGLPPAFLLPFHGVPPSSRRLGGEANAAAEAAASWVAVWVPLTRPARRPPGRG